MADGTLEYELLATLTRRNELGLAPHAPLAHRQSWGRGAGLRVHFESGRAYGASSRAWRTADRAAWFLALPAMPFRIYRITAPALRCGAGGAPPGAADRAWLLALILANVAGQLAGALAGEGESHRRLV
jgi:hypothetical protein